MDPGERTVWQLNFFFFGGGVRHFDFKQVKTSKITFHLCFFRLEMLQQIANRVQRDCVNGEDKLALARTALQSVSMHSQFNTPASCDKIAMSWKSFLFLFKGCKTSWVWYSVPKWSWDRWLPVGVWEYSQTTSSGYPDSPGWKIPICRSACPKVQSTSFCINKTLKFPHVIKKICLKLSSASIQGVKTPRWSSSPESRMLLCVQQRPHPDNRANQNDDLRHHTESELWLLPEH